MECTCCLVQFIWMTLIIHIALLSSTTGKFSGANILEGLPPSDYREYRWSEWSSWSQCTRSCGGGIAMQRRYCLPASANSSQVLNTTLPTPVVSVRITREVENCVGGNKRYHQCNTMPCPDASRDTRAEQCAAFNKKPFRRRYYTWVPYVDGNAPCILNCRPLGQPFYASLALVTDGTPCTKPGRKAMCLDGSCIVVGMRPLFANAAESDLRCGSHMVSGLFKRPKLPIGYTYVTTVPRGACQLNVTELTASENFIALRVSNGSYIINGQFAVSTPGTFEAVGARFQYSRIAGRDWIYSVGPLYYPVDIMVLYTRPSPSIKYEYFTDPLQAEIDNDSLLIVDGAKAKHSRRHQSPSYLREFGEDFDGTLVPIQTDKVAGSFGTAMPSTVAPTTEVTDDSKVYKAGLRKFSWKITFFTTCTRSCGGGSQMGKYKCIEGGAKEVSPVHCIGNPPPIRRRRCNTNPCPARWRASAWSDCPSCGPANRTRIVGCVQDNARGIVKILDKNCHDPKPSDSEICVIPDCDSRDSTSADSKGATGHIDNFKEGRTYLLSARQAGSWPTPNGPTPTAAMDVHISMQNKSVLSTTPKVIEKSEHNLTLGIGWILTEWSECVGWCGFPGIQSRAVRCTNVDGCEPLPQVAISRECTESEECQGEAQWFTGEWSACSSECGGWQTRGVICVARGVLAPRAQCRGPAPPAARPCAAPCRPTWFVADWQECSGQCFSGAGGMVGWQQRTVVCTVDNGPDSGCEARCNTAPPDARQPCVPACASRGESKKPKTTTPSTTTRKPVPKGKPKKCKDQLPNCGLAVQARLCHYNYYIKNCCQSCKGRH